MKKALIVWTAAAMLLAPAAAQAKRYNLLMDYGQDILVAGKEDDVAVRAQCIQNEGGGGFDVLRVYAVAANNSAMKGFDSYAGFNTFLTAVTLPVDAEISMSAATSGQESFANTIDTGFVLNLTTLHGYAFASESTILGLNSGSHDCVLSINLDAIKKFKTVD